jgi:hypothetical protein
VTATVTVTVRVSVTVTAVFGEKSFAAGSSRNSRKGWEESCRAGTTEHIGVLWEVSRRILQGHG